MDEGGETAEAAAGEAGAGAAAAAAGGGEVTAAAGEGLLALRRTSPRTCCPIHGSI